MGSILLMPPIRYPIRKMALVLNFINFTMLHTFSIG
jgi:hypothetical protein